MGPPLLHLYRILTEKRTGTEPGLSKIFQSTPQQIGTKQAPLRSKIPFKHPPMQELP